MFVELDLLKRSRLNTLTHTHTHTFPGGFLALSHGNGVVYAVLPVVLEQLEDGVNQTQQAGTGSTHGEMALLRPDSHSTWYNCTICPTIAYIDCNSSLQVLLW